MKRPSAFTFISLSQEKAVILTRGFFKTIFIDFLTNEVIFIESEFREKL